MSKNVAVKDEEAKLPAVIDFSADAGLGLETISNDDLQIPFISLLQALSPEVDPENGIKGAQQGMLLNKATQELFDGKEGIGFVPIYLEKKYVEWVPKGKGGGLVAQYDPKDPMVVAEIQKNGKYKGITLANGNELIETSYLYVVLVPSQQPAIIAFTSTKLTPLKNWLTKLNYFQATTPDGRKYQPPMFYHQVKLTSIRQKNKKDEPYYNFVLSPLVGVSLEESRLTDPEIYARAKETFTAIKEGKVKVDFTKADVAGATGDPVPAGTVGDNGEEVPF